MVDRATAVSDNVERILASDDPVDALRSTVTDAGVLSVLNTRVLWSFFSSYVDRRSTDWSAQLAETALKGLEERQSAPNGRQWLIEIAFHANLALAGTDAFYHNSCRIEDACETLERDGISRSSQYIRGLLAYMRDDMHGAEAAFSTLLSSSDKPLLAHHAGYPAFRAPGFYRTLTAYNPPRGTLEYVLRDQLPPDTSTVVLCAADDVYFSAFADDFARNVLEVAPTACIHFHLINNTIPPARIVDSALLADERIHLTTEKVAGTDLRTYTTMARYLLLPILLERWGKPVLVSDIDMTLTTDPAVLDTGDAVTLAFSHNPCAAYIPPVSVLAHQAHFYPSAAGHAFATMIARYLRYMHEHQHAFWTVDQMALLAVWRMLRNSIPVRRFGTVTGYHYRMAADRPLKKTAAKERIATAAHGG